MKKLLLALSCVVLGQALAVEPVPATWKNNPTLGQVYEVIETVPALPYAPEVPKGTKVVISRRYLSDQLTRGLDTTKKLGLQVVGGKNEDDPGISDSYIPYLEAGKYLRLTKEAGPLAHWEQHAVKFADKEIPNLKPNHYSQHNFAVNTYLAVPHEKERPMLVAGGLIVRMIPPSPHCLDSEVTVRLQESRDNWYLDKMRRENPDFALAGPWFGTDYCVSYRDFLNEFRPTAGLVDESLPDRLSWDEAVEHFHSKFVLKAMQKAVVKVSPYSKDDEAEGRSAPSIRVVAVADLKAEDRGDLPADGWVAEYSGSLYYSCAGGFCRAQGYRIALDGKGKLLRFLKNHLYSWDGHNELPLDAEDETRLIELCNDRKQLEALHVSAKTESGESYSAKMSALSHARRRSRAAGNSYGTFVVHVSKIRAQLGLNAEWPIYDGKAPKASETGTGLRLK